MNTEKLIQWVRNFDVIRNANLIIIQEHQSKKQVKVFHSATSEESEQKLQSFINEQCKE